VPELAAGTTLPADLAACKFVVVLGSGHTDVAGVAANNRLAPSGLARITEGVRLLRALPPDAKLIVSGPARPGGAAHAEVLAQAAVALGIARERIIEFSTARDTEDEAAEVKKIAGAAPVALVTSAWHMPRSMALFAHTGVRALACPTDFTGLHLELRDFYTWDAAALVRTSWTVRERVGWLWIWLRGRTAPAPELANGGGK
jgi:uncharacterized SAM-binding protein YcdF (DUF218 family)